MFVKPLSKIYKLHLQWNLYQFSPYAPFSCIINLFWSRKFTHIEQCLNVSGASFLKVLYDSFILSEFLVLTHNIARMIISEEKQWKQYDISGM